jgi:hypothetical protein
LIPCNFDFRSCILLEGGDQYSSDGLWGYSEGNKLWSVEGRRSKKKDDHHLNEAGSAIITICSQLVIE